MVLQTPSSWRGEQERILKYRLVQRFLPLASHWARWTAKTLWLLSRRVSFNTVSSLSIVVIIYTLEVRAANLQRKETILLLSVGYFADAEFIVIDYIFAKYAITLHCFASYRSWESWSRHNGVPRSARELCACWSSVKCAGRFCVVSWPLWCWSSHSCATYRSHAPDGSLYAQNDSQLRPQTIQNWLENGNVHNLNIHV